MDYIILTLIWGVYFALHSVLASNGVKMYFKRSFPAFYPFYRLCYNLISTVLLVPVYLFQKGIEPIVLFEAPEVVGVVGGIAMLVGIVIGALAFRYYSTKEFIGLDFNNESYSLQKGSLNVSGLNKFVRHPLYFATLAIVWGYFLVKPTLTILVIDIVISVYLVIGARLEEKKLIAEFGEQYLQYKKRVSMLVPFVF